MQSKHSIKPVTSFLFDLGPGDGTSFVHALLSPVKEKETNFTKKKKKKKEKGRRKDAHEREQTTLFPFLFGASDISQSHVDRQTLPWEDISSCRHAQRDRQTDRPAPVGGRRYIFCLSPDYFRTPKKKGKARAKRAQNCPLFYFIFFSPHPQYQVLSLKSQSSQSKANPQSTIPKNPRLHLRLGGSWFFPRTAPHARTHVHRRRGSDWIGGSSHPIPSLAIIVGLSRRTLPAHVRDHFHTPPPLRNQNLRQARLRIAVPRPCGICCHLPPRHTLAHSFLTRSNRSSRQPTIQ